ncbi:MAG: glycosyltransferase family 9 protein [Candidatus Kryptoniota bacterium]
MPQKFRRIIVSRTDHIGDVVLSLPVFASLKKCFPGSQIVALVSDYTADVVRSSPYVDEVITYSAGESIFSTVQKFKNAKLDAILFLFPRFRLSAAAYLAGIPIKVGTAYRWYSFLFNRKVHEHRKTSKKNEAEYNIALADILGCKKKSFDMTLKLNADAVARVKMFLEENNLGKFIVVHPGSSGSAFEWGADKFRKLVESIPADLQEEVIVTGTAPEHSLCEAISKGILRATNTAGKFSLLEFIALLSEADAFISNSTGPIHLAAAVGTPVIGIYPNKEPMTPIRWAPLTDRKVILTPNDGSDNLALITINDVIESTRKFISVNSR